MWASPGNQKLPNTKSIILHLYEDYRFSEGVDGIHIYLFSESWNTRIKGTPWGFKEINLKDMKGNAILQKVVWYVQAWENIAQVEVLHWIIGRREYWRIPNM